MLTRPLAPEVADHAPRFWRNPLASWLLQRQLDDADRAISRLEAALDDEFALVDTRPLHEELRRLQLLRAATAARLERARARSVRGRHRG